MMDKPTIGVVIPCYAGGHLTIKMIPSVLKFSDTLVLVDDACPLKTGKKINSIYKSSKIHVIYNKKNLGVGASTRIGFEFLLKEGCDIIVKLDADNQMNPEDIPKLISPIINNECDSTKGNRFTSIESINGMPKLRLLGNIFLSFITKFSTGYWELFDPTNGFIAFKNSALRKINLDKTNPRFFFETELLFRCSLRNLCIKNVQIDSFYGQEYSSLNPLKELPNFFIKNLKLIIKRIIYQYFILDFNPGSLDLVLSLTAGLFSLFIGLYSILNNFSNNNLTSAGTVGLFTISTILSIQFFTAFIFYDCSTKVIYRNTNFST